MEQLVDMSDDDLLVLVGATKDASDAVAAEERRQYDAAFESNVDEFMTRTKKPLVDQVLRRQIANVLRPMFKHIPTDKESVAVAALKLEVRNIMPGGLWHENWNPGDCYTLDEAGNLVPGCLVIRVYHHDTREASKTKAGVVDLVRTIHAVKCPAHSEIETLADLHDAHDAESLIRSSTMRKLHQDYEGALSQRTADGRGLESIPGAIGIAWEGTGTARSLIVVAPALTDDQHAEIVAWAYDTHGAQDDGRPKVWSGATADAAFAMDRDVVAEKVAALRAVKADVAEVAEVTPKGT